MKRPGWVARCAVLMSVIALTAAVPLVSHAADLGPGAPAVVTGAISGTVTSAGGVPVAGATVTAAYYPSSPSTTTDLGGRYTLSGLATGQYQVQFIPPPSAPLASQWYRSDGLPPTSGTPVGVTAGATTAGIDGTLAPGGNISGTVTTMAGAALPSVSACAYPTASGSSPCASTDATGAYRLDNIPTGSYAISFGSAQNGTYRAEFFDDVPDPASATVLNLGAGQTIAGVNARLNKTCSAFSADCTTIASSTGCLTATYVATLTAVLKSCGAGTSFQWTDADGHNVVGNPVTLTYSSKGPWTVTASQTTGGSVFMETIAIGFPSTLTVPAAPIAPTALPMDASAAVAWVEPNNGNTPITGYTVTASPGGHTCTWTSGPRSCLVTGLANGTAHTFTVRATNSIGTGPVSPASVPVTPAAPPSAPTGVTAAAGNGIALVSWLASASDGGTPIIGYVATASPGGQSCAAPVGLACSVSGLTNGVPTTFVVRAVNGAGMSAASAASAAVTPSGPPTQPLAVSGVPGNGSVQVSWTAPANNGGSAIVGYTVTALPGPGTCSTLGALTCLVPGLTNGAAYIFTVVATNATGPGLASAPSPVVVPGAPGSPTGVSAVAGKQDAQVSWLAPASAGVSPVTGYKVMASPYGPTCTTAALTCTVRGLTAGTPYTFTVVAANSVGVGQASTPSTAVVPWSGSGYHPVVPSRILDSRVATGWSGKLAASTPRVLQVTGLPGASSVPVTASAVVMNVTATGASAGSFLKVWPNGFAQPDVSSLNFAPGVTIPNLVTVKIGTGGKVSFANAVGSVDVVGDVVGYYDDGTGPGDLFTGISPRRLLDSRSSTGGWNGKLAAGTPRDLAVRLPERVGGVPATATAVIANITVTAASSGSFVSVWPSGVAQPISSNLNFAPGQTISNLAVVQIGTGGALRFANDVGQVDVVVDVVGYFQPSSGSRFHAIVPTRFLDSRIGQGTYGAWGAGEIRTVYFGSYGPMLVPADATALVANLTVTSGSAGSFVTAFPGNTSLPTASNINFAPGQTIPNLATVAFGPNQTIALYNKAGTVELIGDAVGYYGTS